MVAITPLPTILVRHIGTLADHQSAIANDLLSADVSDCCIFDKGHYLPIEFMICVTAPTPNFHGHYELIVRTASGGSLRRVADVLTPVYRKVSA